MTGSHHNDEHAHTDTYSASKDWGQVGLIALLVLAIVASILMVLTDSMAAQRIALLAALWAAVVGIFLVTRYRRQVQEREEELAYREDIYLDELERLRAEGSTSTGDGDVLADIKEQLSVIRAQLEELSGRDFTYEPAALRAEARRIQQLEERAHSAADRSFEYETDADVQAGSSVNFTQASTGRPSADAIAGRLGNSPTSPRQDNPLADLIQERQAGVRSAKPKSFDTGSFQAVQWDAGGDPEVSAVPTNSFPASTSASRAQEKEGESASKEGSGQHEAPSHARGRRRSDAHRQGSVTVAELLAAAKKEPKDSHNL
ncbi:MAG: DUF6779 domain-containing protein [Corynebacterium sp.]|nr:DUF6779 domain-containing protein [Corynebacterium sp.]